MELQKFEFKGREVRTVVLDGEPALVGKDVCAALEIKNSRDAINRLDQEGVGIADTLTAGGVQQVKVLKEPAVYELIFQSRVSQAKAFKRWVTREVLPAIRKHGGYISPRATDSQLDRLQEAIDHAKGQAGVISLLRGVIDAKHLEAKARVVLARAMGETPEIADEDMPLYTESYLKEKGLPEKWVKSNRGTFGKRVKQAFIQARGYEPSTSPGEVDGRVRKMLAYTESDRPLMDAVWDAYYAETFPEIVAA